MSEHRQRRGEPMDESSGHSRQGSARAGVDDSLDAGLEAGLHGWLDDVRIARRAECAPHDVRERLLERARELGRSVEGQVPSLPLEVEAPLIPRRLRGQRPLMDPRMCEHLIGEWRQAARFSGEDRPLGAWAHPLLGRVAGASLMLGVVVLVIADVRLPGSASLTDSTDSTNSTNSIGSTQLTGPTQVTGSTQFTGSTGVTPTRAARAAVREIEQLASDRARALTAPGASAPAFSVVSGSAMSVSTPISTGTAAFSTAAPATIGTGRGEQTTCDSPRGPLEPLAADPARRGAVAATDPDCSPRASAVATRHSDDRPLVPLAGRRPIQPSVVRREVSSLAQQLAGALASGDGSATTPFAGDPYSQGAPSANSGAPWASPQAALSALRAVTMPFLQESSSYPKDTQIVARGNVRAQPGNNLITNGDFSRGDLMWSVRSWRGFGDTSIAAYYSVQAGALCTPLERNQQVIGGWPWDDRRLSPSAFGIERGKRYRLSLRAWSTGPERVQLVVKVGHQKPPFTPALVTEVPITAEQGLFEIDFVAGRHDAVAGFSFVATGPSEVSSSGFCIDDVALRPLDAEH